MRRIASQSELEQIHGEAAGFIYNDFARKVTGGRKNNVLHRADCHWIKRTTANVPKYHFDTLQEAVAWLGRERGLENVGWKRCRTCRPGKGVAPGEIPARASIERARVRPAVTVHPFTEREVEEILLRWLDEHGYAVQTQVQVPGGIADLVISGRQGEWIVEVKGEDQGGYTSAQMNFQMGIGQLLSRMTDTSKRYALAFPQTENYKTVLEKYKETFGTGICKSTSCRSAATGRSSASRGLG